MTTPLHLRAALAVSDWVPVRQMPVPEGVTLNAYEIVYMDAGTVRTSVLKAPSLNLAVRYFGFLQIGALWQIREVAG